MVETGDGGGCSQQAESVRPKLAAQRQLDEGTQSACFVPGARFGHTYLRVPRTCRMRVSTRRSLSSCTGARPMLACTFMPARHGHLRAPPDRQSPFIPYHPGVFGPLLEGLSWWKLPLSAGFWFAPVTLITELMETDLYCLFSGAQPPARTTTSSAATTRQGLEAPLQQREVARSRCSLLTCRLACDTFWRGAMRARVPLSDRQRQVRLG